MYRKDLVHGSFTRRRDLTIDLVVRELTNISINDLMFFNFRLSKHIYKQMDIKETKSR